MVFKTKFNKGLTPCNVCQIGSHSHCKKSQYCSCNCPNKFSPILHSNQNRKKTHCLRGHEFTMVNTYMSKTGNYRMCKACQKIRRETNRERIRETARKSYHKHKNEYRLLRRIGAKTYLQRVKQTVLTYYGNGNLSCACCGEKEIRFLTLDHVIQIGRKNMNQTQRGHNLYRYLIKNKFPSGYQTLCFNCNSGRALNKGICPHKEKLTRLALVAKEGEGQFLN